MKKRISSAILAILLLISLLPAVSLTANAATAGVGTRKIDGGKRDFSWPVPGNYGISSCYLDGATSSDPDGRSHYAIDIPATKGTGVVASYPGTVVATYTSCTHNSSKTYTCCNDGFGNYVVLSHNYTLSNGSTMTLYSRYSHLTSVSVSKGQSVSTGTQIGTVGSTGYSQGFHLDFQILQNTWTSRAANGLDPYLNELLELPSGVYCASTSSCCGVGPTACCCYLYIEHVKSLYATKQDYASNECTPYPCAVKIEVTEDCCPYTQPCNPTTASELGYVSEKLTGKPLSAGDILTASGLYENSEGNYWYKVTLSDGTSAYLYSTHTEMDSLISPWVDGGGFPTSITGATSLQGTVTAGGALIDSVQAFVYPQGSNTAVLQSNRVTVNAQSYPLKSSTVDNTLIFQDLANHGAGNYVLEIVADFTTYYADNNQLQTSGLCDKPVASYNFYYGSSSGTPEHTCNQDTYVYYWASHPHYNCYRCSVCGAVSENRSETNQLNTCAQCRPGKPVMNVSTDGACGSEGVVTFSWAATANTTHYNVWIQRQSDDDSWYTIEQNFEIESGFTRALDEGSYRVQLLSYNSKMWEPDGSDWVHTCADDAYFTVGHSISNWEYTWPDCVSDGTASGTCSNCAETVSIAIAPRGHDLTSEMVPATCTYYACIRYTCTSCGYSYDDYAGTEYSDWSTAYPSGVDESLIESKTQYRYSDYETTTSYDTSLDGWSRVGSSWQQSGSGTIQYVKSWPSGFLTSHNLYSTYNKTPKSASETETDKITIGSDKVTGYLYYHWCRGTYTAGPINRTTKPSKEGEYNTFHAFYSTTNPSTLQSDSDGSVVYANADCCTDSHWYFHTSVNTQSYTTYRNLFTYARWTDWSDWSDTVYTESDTRSVETRTLYRYYAGGLADHVWENGYCVNCGEMDPNYDTTPTGVYVQSVFSCPGEVVSIPVYLTDNDGFAGFTLTIDHDSRMTLVDISRGYLLDTSDSGSFTANVSGRTVNWVDYQNTYGDGVIFDLIFQLPEDANDGECFMISIGLKDGLASNFVDENAASKNVFFVEGDIEMDVAAEIASGWSGDLTWRLTDDGNLTFSGSGKMKNYEYKSEMPWYGYRDQINAVILEDGVTSIGAYAFYGMPSLGYISIPNSVTTIGDYAFKNCPLLDYVYLPQGLTSLGDSAFYACTSLSFIDIPASLWTVKDYTFKNCTALESVTFHEGNLMKISDGAFYNTALTAVSFPDCLSIIDGYSFKNCSKLASITLGSGINQVREAAFYGSAISEITIPEGVTSIKPYAFKNCVNLRSVDLPSTLTIVDEAAFYACTALESLDLPDAVTSIGNYAFRKCESLGSLSLGAGLVTIGECSFYGCESLVYLSVPGKVTTIKPYAFKGCTGLEYVTLPNSLETLGESAFHTCPNLSEVTIPAKVATVGAYCFSGSTGIDTFSFLGNAPSIGSGAFNKITATAYYPSGNTSWTASVRQNYGGNITWIAE